MADLSFLISAPLRLEVGAGRTATISRWSLEGFVPPRGLEGGEGEARLTLPFNGFDITFDVRLERDPEGDFMRFVDLGERRERVLRHFYREIVTGRAEPVDQMIWAMDIPVEPVPMQQTAEESKAAPRPGLPRSYRAAAVVALYAVMGVLLYGPIISPVIDRVGAMGDAVLSDVALPPVLASDDSAEIAQTGPIVWHAAPASLSAGGPEATVR